MSRTVGGGEDAVWRLLADASARPAWCRGVRSVEGAPPAPVSPGDAWTESRDVLGVDETERVRVHEAAEGRTLVLEVDGEAGTARSGTLRFTWTLTPIEGGTRVGVACDAAASTRKGSILLRFLSGPWARQVEDELEGLEAVVTGAPDDSGP